MDDRGHATDHSTAIHVGAGGRVGDITVQGDVAGRDIVKITEELTYDVSDLSANPYLGLASYTYATRAFYGGREPLVREAVARLTAPGDEPVLVFVTGASGSGKSSFAQAGLLPAFEDAYAQQGRQVRWSVVRPGRHPIEALGRALRELGLAEPRDGDWIGLLRTPEDLNHLLDTQTPSGQMNVLVFDQFEELFTQADAAERDTACALLSGLGSFKQLRTHVIATLRADYLSALFDAPVLLERFKQDGIELRAMSSDELARAIRQPLQARAKLEGKDKRIDPALVERLVEDVGDDPSLLPLLQVTLRALWDEPPHRMVLERYRSLTHTLEQQANQVFDRDARGRERTPAEREQLMGVFLDLVEVSLDDDPRRDVRRTLPKEELLEGHPERAELIEELVGARLMTTSVEHARERDVEVVDIIHETLLGNWPRLSEEIAARREALQQRERFRLALREWLREGRRQEYLLQGVRLAEARSLAERNDVALRDPDGQAFLQASTEAEAEAHTRELRQARRRQRILGAVAGVAGTFAAIALLAAGFAISSQRAADAARVQAEQQARVATSRQLAAEGLNHLADHLDLALLMAAQAYRTEPTIEARGALLSALEFSPSLDTFLNGHTKRVFTVAFSPDGKTLATGSEDRTIRLWNMASRQLQGDPLSGHSDIVQSIAFSPDGTSLASASMDGTVRLWDVASRQPIGAPLIENSGPISVTFSPDGRTLAVALGNGTVRLWDAFSRQPLGDLTGHTRLVNSVAFSPDGATLASGSGDGTVRVWDSATRQPLDTFFVGDQNQVHSVAYSPDGKTLAAGCDDGTVRLWDTAGHQALGEPLAGQSGAVNSLAFSPDSTILAVSSRDGTVLLWSVANRQPAALPISGHTGDVRSVAFSPDGTRLASASDDGTLRLWDVANRYPLGTPLSHTSPVTGVVFSHDGTILASSSSSSEGTAWVWKVGSARPLLALRDLGMYNANSVALSSDGTTLATASLDGIARLWDITGQQTSATRLTGYPGYVSAGPRLNDAVTSVAFTPDGTILASAGDKTVRLWNVASQKPLGEPLVVKDVKDVTFSADGRTLATASQDGAVQLWEVASHQALGTPLGPPATPDTHYTFSINSVAFSPDGSILASGGADKTVRLWDVASHQPIGTPLTGHTAGVTSVAFSPDGATLASASGDNTVRLWDIRAGSWFDRVCRVVNRNMTLAEWTTVLGAKAAYQRSCPDLPPGDGAPPDAR